MAMRSLLNPASSCDHPLERNLALAQRMGVQGTPTLVWADGSRTDGYVERSVLEARLKQVAGTRAMNTIAVPGPHAPAWPAA